MEVKEVKGINMDDLKLKMEIPELFCKYGIKSEAREMIKAHNAMISRKAGAFDSSRRPEGRIMTPEDGERLAEARQAQLLSSFEDAGYRSTAKRFLEKLLPKVKQDVARYDAEVQEATAKRNEAIAKLQEATEELNKTKARRAYFCGEIGRLIIKPFLYANDGGGALLQFARIPQRLYPQLGFSCPSYNYEPVDHIEYMLQEIDRRDSLSNAE